MTNLVTKRKNTFKKKDLLDLFPDSKNPVLIADLSFISTDNKFSNIKTNHVNFDSLTDIADIFIVNPGFLKKIFENKQLKNKKFIIRLDWTNALRDESYPLKADFISHILISSVSDAVSLGASGVCVTHLIGYGDNAEVKSFKNLNRTIRESEELDLVVFSHIYSFGPDISKQYFNIAIEMGASMGFEAGADGLFVPDADIKTYNNINKFCRIPIFIWHVHPENFDEDSFKNLGGNIKGFVLGKEFFTENIDISTIKKLVSKNE